MGDPIRHPIGWFNCSQSSTLRYAAGGISPVSYYGMHCWCTLIFHDIQYSVEYGDAFIHFHHAAQPNCLKAVDFYWYTRGVGTPIPQADDAWWELPPTK